MRLSEAIVLGSTVITPNPGGILHDDGSGCALGMALEAAGKTRHVDVISGLPKTIAFFRNRDTIRSLWPWLKGDFPVPCACSRNSWSTGFNLITHLFDDHVFGRADWTLERLVSWIHSVELQGEEPKPGVVASSRDVLQGKS